MDDDSEDVPEVTGFFSKRAKFVPKITSEDLQAASKLLEHILEERKKSSLAKDNKPVPAKKCKRKASKNKYVHPDVINIEDDLQSSPSVPRSAAAKRRLRKVQRECKKEVKREDDLQSSPSVSLSAAAKRRLRKVQKECKEEVKRVEDANEKVLSSLNTPSIVEIENEVIDVHDKENFLTILYLTEISRLKYYENEKFSTIFPRVADLFKLNVSEFLLCLKNRNITVDDSPDSLNITHSDIIECIPYKARGNGISKYDDNRLKLLFQASDVKQKTEMFVHKLEKMDDVMKKYSKIRNIPLDQMVFEFDGEQISGTENPQVLEMESGNCIDVRILNAEDKLSRKGSAKINNETMIDLTEDNDSCDPDIIFCC